MTDDPSRADDEQTGRDPDDDIIGSADDELEDDEDMDEEDEGPDEE